jgi:enoyl-CoA hydratase/carnithine racemase
MTETCPEITTHQHGHVLEMRIERPERKNALTQAMYTALTEALQAGEADSGVRALLITGTEDCFTAGNDMGDFLNNPAADEDAPVMRFLNLLPVLTKPLLAAVNGPAVGVGTTLLLHCDLVYLGADARLQLPFVNLGLCPEAGSSLLLPAIMGHQRAAELLLLGESFDAARARELGLANEVLASSAYRDHARAKAQQLAQQPAAAARLTKQLLKEPQREQLQRQMAEEGRAFRERLVSPEAREAMQAFMEKRQPDFTQFD